MKPALAFVAPSPVALPARPVAVSVPQPARPNYADPARAPRSRRLVLVGIAALHVLGLWGLSRMQDVRHTLQRVTPIVVRIVTPAEPPKPQPPQPVAMPEFKSPPTTLIEPPLIAIAAAPAPAPVVAALPPPPPAVAPVQTAPAPVVQVVPPPAPPTIKRLPASAVRWLKEPRMTVPLMSKRLRESGVVQVRVVVDVNGLPREVSLAKSSGFARLDEQALQDIRTARFVPYTENGQAVEWEVIAPMSYEVDR
ncbi:TonB family protein [Pelomonas cellulosilytica]|uniref:Energy transducer TonB n=1 Tax=Pelomonas cellulosilytica TaxID=2906762 RepID=A0ABS8XXL0_9BURK|nr:energy transducer TonB [Pelomonas sp. P8]